MTERTDVTHLRTSIDLHDRDEAATRPILADVPVLARVPVDLIVAFVLTLAAAIATLMEMPAGVRVPLGVLLVLALPGFALLSLLFPSDGGPDGIARTALSVALSLATIPFLALAIEQSPWRIERVTITIGLTAITLTCLVAATVLRSRLPVTERYVARFPAIGMPPPRSWTLEQILIGGGLLIAAALFAFGGFDVVATRVNGERTTEFALYNPGGKPEFYPREVVAGEAAEVEIGITNHEGKLVRYQIVVSGAGQETDVIPELQLDDDESQLQTVRFTVMDTGNDLPVRFELYRVDDPADSAPYRTLVLRVDGVESAAT